MDVAVFHQDFAVGLQTSVGDGFAQFQHRQPRLGDGDCRPDIDSGGQLFGEIFGDHMPEGIYRDDLARFGPLRIRANRDDWRRVVQIRLEVGIQPPGGDRCCQIDGITARMGTDRVPRCRIGDRSNDRAAFGRITGAPVDRRSLTAFPRWVRSQYDMFWSAHGVYSGFRNKRVKVTNNAFNVY